MTSDVSQMPTNIEPKIRNCRMKYECDQSWIRMKETGRLNVRFCEACQKEVHFIKNRMELALAIQNGRCVCVPYDLFEKKEQMQIRRNPKRIPYPNEQGRMVQVTTGMLEAVQDELSKVRDVSDIPAWLRKPGGRL